MDNEAPISERQFLESILHGYIVRQSVPGAVWCRSKEGMDADKWDVVFTKIKDYFGNRFKEVFHVTNYMHRHFCVYFSATMPKPITHTN